MYDGTHTYDFSAEVDVARKRAKALTLLKTEVQVKAESTYMDLFNSGQTYREVTYGYGYPTRSKPIGRVVSVVADEKQLRRHEAKFADAPKQRRRSTPNLKGQVLELHSRGVVATAIADQLNIADRRVKEIIGNAPAHADYGMVEQVA